MNQIKFNTNWNNKLSGKIFSTIRKASRAKFYQSNLKNTFEVVLKNRVLYNAKLINVRVMQFNRVPFALLSIDTGYSDVDKIIDLFKKFETIQKLGDEVVVLTFEKLENTLEI